LSPVHPKEQALLCANGFRDTTRVASGSPEMWQDIALANRKNISRVLGVFIEDLREFQVSLENGDVKAIQEFLEQGKQRRDRWRGRTFPSCDALSRLGFLPSARRSSNARTSASRPVRRPAATWV